MHIATLRADEISIEHESSSYRCTSFLSQFRVGLPKDDAMISDAFSCHVYLVSCSHARNGGRWCYPEAKHSAANRDRMVWIGMVTSE